jgi:predicted dehydrogenase
MIAARDRAKKLLMTAQHMRFGRNTENLKAYLDTGAMGKVYYARAHLLRRRFIPGWGGKGRTFIDRKVSGGGPTIDIGVHILDLTLHLMGQPEPVTVSGVAPCKIGKRNDIRGWWGEWDRELMNVEDFAAGFVRFKDGSALSLECSWLLNIKEKEYMKVWLMGTEAGAEWPELTVYGEKAGCLTDTQLAFPDDKVPAHHLELEAFQNAILHKKPSPVPAEQSLKVQRILDGLYRSQQAGKEVRV